VEVYRLKKVIGGENGLLEETIKRYRRKFKTIVVSSKIILELQKITLGYAVNGSVTNLTRFNFTTNSESGEFRESWR
jgi:hypothetical protein